MVANWGAPNLRVDRSQGYPFSVRTAPAAAKANDTMTTFVSYLCGTRARSVSRWWGTSWGVNRGVRVLAQLHLAAGC